MSTPNGGDLLVRVLRELGVDTVFGIVSVHNLPLVEAVARDLRFVPVRHEATAVSAADAYGRARGTLGCALTSTGTGAGNAAGSLIEALSAQTAVLHVTGQIDSPYLGQGRGFIHETKDQPGMLAAVSHHAATVTEAADAGRVLRTAAAAALTAPGGPAEEAGIPDALPEGDTGGYAPGASSGARARGRFTRNFVVQGSAADWALLLLAALRSSLAPLRAELVFFQHDEVIVHCPDEEAPAVVAAIAAASDRATAICFGDVPVRFPFTTAVVGCYAEAKG